jgi:hypothetical protein
MLIACRCVRRYHTVMLSWLVRRVIERACQPCSKSVHASRVKEHACHPCFNGYVHVKLNFRVTVWRIACWCVCPPHKMLIACRCVRRYHTVMLSWWVHRVKECACHPCFNGYVHVKLNVRVTIWRIACWCVCPTHKMLIACRCVSRTHNTVMLWGSTVLKSYYQTKIVEGGTKDEMRISNEALFNGQFPKLSTPTIEQSFCCSSFKIFVWEG